MEELTAVLQAHTLALSALFATHPQPHELRRAFETMVSAAPNSDPLYERAIETLRHALPAA